MNGDLDTLSLSWHESCWIGCVDGICCSGQTRDRCRDAPESCQRNEFVRVPATPRRNIPTNLFFVFWDAMPSGYVIGNFINISCAPYVPHCLDFEGPRIRAGRQVVTQSPTLELCTCDLVLSLSADWGGTGPRLLPFPWQQAADSAQLLSRAFIARSLGSL